MRKGIRLEIGEDDRRHIVNVTVFQQNANQISSGILGRKGTNYNFTANGSNNHFVDLCPLTKKSILLSRLTSLGPIQRERGVNEAIILSDFAKRLE